MNFVDYFNGADLEMLVRKEMERLDVQLEDRAAVFSMLAPLDAKGPIGRFHRDHSMRVALVAVRLAAHEQIDQRAMLFAGLLHDVGKALVPGCTLAATAQWTPADAAEMEKHVVDGWRLLRDRFDFTAHVIARHHQHQSRPYPAELPKVLQPFSEATLEKAEQCSWLLAVADVYDALHRINTATGGKGLSEAEIRDSMRRAFANQGEHVESFYEPGGVFPFELEINVTKSNEEVLSRQQRELQELYNAVAEENRRLKEQTTCHGRCGNFVAAGDAAKLYCADCNEGAKVLNDNAGKKGAELVKQLVAALRADSPCCSCCDGRESYKELVQKVERMVVEAGFALPEAGS